MISISKRYRFEAAHWLPHVNSSHKCRNMHGHNYEVVITVQDKVDERGMVMDFFDLDAAMAPILNQLDHTCLNDTISNPTAELIAQWIGERVTYATAIRVYERDDCWAEWTR